MDKRSDKVNAPMLFPYEPEEFWKLMRDLIRQELNQKSDRVELAVDGLTQKPLYKIGEVCKLFNVTRPTIYDWIKHGKLKPFKIRSRVYFLWRDLEGLMGTGL